MNGGQQIDPGLIQALQSISSSQEDQNNLKQQMAMAQAMRPPPLNNAQMAGKVVVRNSPLATAANAGQNMLAQYQMAQALRASQANASKLRDARGRIISDVQAHYNAQNDPSQNHPDTNAALGVTPDSDTTATSMAPMEEGAEAMSDM